MQQVPNPFRKVLPVDFSKAVELFNQLLGVIRPGLTLPDSVTDMDSLELAVNIVLSSLGSSQKPAKAAGDNVWPDNPFPTVFGLKQTRRTPARTTKAMESNPVDTVRALRAAGLSDESILQQMNRLGW